MKHSTQIWELGPPGAGSKMCPSCVDIWEQAGSCRLEIRRTWAGTEMCDSPGRLKRGGATGKCSRLRFLVFSVFTSMCVSYTQWQASLWHVIHVHTCVSSTHPFTRCCCPPMTADSFLLPRALILWRRNRKGKGRKEQVRKRCPQYKEEMEGFWFFRECSCKRTEKQRWGPVSCSVGKALADQTRVKSQKPW